VVSLVCPCCPWLVLAPKVFQLCTNHFVWVVCKLVWMSKACQLFLVPSRRSNTLLNPSKCCELGSVPWLLPLPLSYTWNHFLVLQGVGSASILMFHSKAFLLLFPPSFKFLVLAHYFWLNFIGSFWKAFRHRFFFPWSISRFVSLFPMEG